LKFQSKQNQRKKKKRIAAHQQPGIVAVVVLLDLVHGVRLDAFDGLGLGLLGRALLGRHECWQKKTKEMLNRAKTKKVKDKKENQKNLKKNL
jgi:hypothetical protein